MKITLFIIAVLNFIVGVSLLGYKHENIASALKYIVNLIFTAALFYMGMAL